MKEKNKIRNVKNVIFQIRYPNLFYLEQKIPDFQMDILDKFPESALTLQQPFPIQNNSSTEDEKAIEKIWEFKNNNTGFEVKVSSRSLSITSYKHESYLEKDGSISFRDMIAFVLNVFKKHVKLPLVLRIGLRYINECNIECKTSENYHNVFDSALSKSKYKIENLQLMHVRAINNLDNCTLIYQEYFDEKTWQDNFIIIDIDAFVNDIPFDNCLPTLDKLHTAISEEYNRTLKVGSLK